MLERTRRWGNGGIKSPTYRVSGEPNPLERIGHETQACAGQLRGGADIALHIHERDGQ